jgi:hypothetical protein
MIVINPVPFDPAVLRLEPFGCRTPPSDVVPEPEGTDAERAE